MAQPARSARRPTPQPKTLTPTLSRRTGRGGSDASSASASIAVRARRITMSSIAQVFGGGGISSIVGMFRVDAGNACGNGALSMAVAVFAVGRRRTIFSCYLFAVIYLVGLALFYQLR